MLIDKISAETNITGARTISRIAMVRVICMEWASLVRRVTRDKVLNEIFNKVCCYALYFLCNN